jgi:Relaxase/Mobilisation nuclease domain
MPAPTPPEKVLAAAKTFAREEFGAKHRYAMALHTHQQHPHVHLVVKAEGIDGRRLHIDKAMLREWRQDFATMMREQGIAANATPRFVRGQTKRAAKDAFYRAPATGQSYALQEEIDVVKESSQPTGRSRIQRGPGCSRRAKRSWPPGTPSPRHSKLRGTSSSAATCATSPAICRRC